MKKKLLQARLLTRDKADFANDLRSRGLSQQQVLEDFVQLNLALIRAGKLPTYVPPPGDDYSAQD